MKRMLLVLAVLTTLTVVPLAQAHNGKHWTNGQAQRHLVSDGFQFDSGPSYPYSALCRGFGHNFIASNGNRVYSKFSCATHWDNGCFMYEIWVNRGFNWTWRDELAVNYC